MDTQFYGLCIELQCILGVQPKPGPMPTANKEENIPVKSDTQCDAKDEERS